MDESQLEPETTEWEDLSRADEAAEVNGEGVQAPIPNAMPPQEPAMPNPDFFDVHEPCVFEQDMFDTQEHDVDDWTVYPPPRTDYMCLVLHFGI